MDVLVAIMHFGLSRQSSDLAIFWLERPAIGGGTGDAGAEGEGGEGTAGMMLGTMPCVDVVNIFIGELAYPTVVLEIKNQIRGQKVPRSRTES